MDHGALSAANTGIPGSSLSLGMQSTPGNEFKKHLNLPHEY